MKNTDIIKYQALVNSAINYPEAKVNLKKYIPNLNVETMENDIVIHIGFDLIYEIPNGVCDVKDILIKQADVVEYTCGTTLETDYDILDQVKEFDFEEYALNNVKQWKQTEK